jgi:hypothetical protein
MNKQEATQFIQQVFQSPFDEQRFGRFAAELLNEIEAKLFLANRKVNDWRLKKSTLWVV